MNNSSPQVELRTKLDDVADEETPLVSFSEEVILPSSSNKRDMCLPSSQRNATIAASILKYNSKFHKKEQQQEQQQHQIQNNSKCSTLSTFVSSIPATVLVVMLNLMLAVPFGSAYFSQVIPLAEGEREKMGIRLSLMALCVGQLVMGGGLGPLGSSGFDTVSVWQLGELSPFYHRLAQIAAHVSTDKSQILPTTLYLLSLSSACVGITIFTLGKLKLGQLTYFFPTHVILGLVGGIGIWLVILSTSVAISPSQAPRWSIATTHFAISFTFAAVLRILRKKLPKGKFMLLDPIYFLSIPLIFYLFLYFAKGISVEQAVEAGYFFADPQSAIQDDDEDTVHISAIHDAFRLWTDFSFSRVQYRAIFPAFTTLITAGIMGTLITAPFIPTVATLQDDDKELDFNREFVSHGWCNLLSAISVPGGLGVAVSYSGGAVYKNAGGKGKLASAFMAMLLFVVMIYGPSLVVHVPRCMASALILDMGINLFLEAVVEPRSRFDALEYASVWLIILVLNMANMTAGLVAGLLAALFTYMLQSLLDKNPVRLSCNTSKLPSSKWRTLAQRKVLESSRGRNKILLFQLQGHLFFGNLPKISKTVFTFLEEQQKNGDIESVILDFSLVLGVDSTSTSFISKMKKKIQKKFDANVVMVSGILDPNEDQDDDVGSLGDGLTRALSIPRSPHGSRNMHAFVFSQTSRSRAFSIDEPTMVPSSPTAKKKKNRLSMTVRGPYNALVREATMIGRFFESLDAALMKCEDEIIAAYDSGSLLHFPSFGLEQRPDEREEILTYLTDKLDEKTDENVSAIIDHCTRECYGKGDVLWKVGTEPYGVMMLMSGTLKAVVVEAGKTKREKIIESGEIVGLETMILKERHRARVTCEEDCVIYVLEKDEYERLTKEDPNAARVLNLYLSKELARRLQHMSGVSGIHLIEQ
jgi:SulP family sulfate permease